jgi:hypothetical protein
LEEKSKQLFSSILFENLTRIMPILLAADKKMENNEAANKNSKL